MPINKEIIKKIYSTYYTEDDTLKEKFVSSHWKYDSEQFDVRLDKDGNLISLEGVGFGDLESKSLIYSFLSYLCIISYFVKIPNRVSVLSLLKNSFAICKLGGFPFTYDCFRQVCSLALIRKYKNKFIKNRKLTVIIIGDGYGYLSALIKMVFPDSTLVLVDIGKTLIFQAFYCQKVHPELKHYYIDDSNSQDTLNDYDFVYCPADRLDKVDKLNYDIAVNMASFQEMNPSIIEKYFMFLRSHLNADNLFYCCNREYKKLIGGEITEFKKYPWKTDDRYLVDGYCPWHVYFFSLSREGRGLKILGMRIPLVRYFDGKILHRLTILSKAN